MDEFEFHGEHNELMVAMMMHDKLARARKPVPILPWVVVSWLFGTIIYLLLAFGGSLGLQ